MKKWLLPIFFIGTIAMMVVMAKTGATLKMPATPHGIIDLEFAYNTAKVSTVLNAWAPVNSIDNITVAKTNTNFDFLFLFCYSVFLFLTCRKIAQSFKGLFAKAGNVIAVGALLAGFFDVIENIGMLLSLNNHTTNLIAFITSLFSILKWGLVLLVILYILTGLITLGWQKLKK